MGQPWRPAVLLLALGHLAGLLASGTTCHNVYQDLSDCILKLGENMATYEEVDGMELQGLHRVCGYSAAKEKSGRDAHSVFPKVEGHNSWSPPLQLSLGSVGRATVVLHQRYWDEFHVCALTALWECQKEAAAVWEMLRRESRKLKFQGSLFDLCSPSMAQSFAWTHVPNVSILGIPFIVTWLNL